MRTKKFTYSSTGDLAKAVFFSGEALEKRATAIFFGYNLNPYGKILRSFTGGDGHERYLTTQHERDHETISENNAGTGLDNRGARFYDSDVPRMLGVDKMAHLAPGWSPYRYAFSNPIMYTDPTGNYETKYEDEAGNLLADTPDGNDATVTISDKNKESFLNEYNSAKESGLDGSMMHNESWIRRFSSTESNTMIPALLAGGAAKLENSLSSTLATKTAYEFKNPGWKPSTAAPKTMLYNTPFGNLTLSKSFVSNAATGLRVGGYGFAAYNAYNLEVARQNGQYNGTLGNIQYGIEQISNGVSVMGIPGAAWSLGWEGGRMITNTPLYQDFKYNTWLPFRQSTLGY